MVLDDRIGIPSYGRRLNGLSGPELERGVRVILVPDFIHRFALAGAAVQPVRAVEYPAGHIADILVSVDYSRRDQDRLRAGGAGHQGQLVAVSRRARPGVPEVNPKVTGTDKREQVGLLHMF